MVTYLSTKGDFITEYCGEKFYSFPRVEQMVKITEKELRDANFGYRAGYIVKTIDQILKNGGTKWVNSLTENQYEDCVKNLTSLTGIGRKVADCIALYSVSKTNFSILFIIFLNHFRKLSLNKNVI